MPESTLLKPRWVGPAFQERTPSRKDMIDGPYHFFSMDGLNSIGYKKYKTYVDRGQRIDYEAENVGLYSHLMEGRRQPSSKPILQHGDVVGTIFEVTRSFLPDGEQMELRINCIDNDRIGTNAFIEATYDAKGWLHLGGARSADRYFREGADIAGHYHINELPPRINMRGTIEEFMRQVNGENEKNAVDFGTPILIPYRKPKYHALMPSTASQSYENIPSNLS